MLSSSRGSPTRLFDESGYDPENQPYRTRQYDGQQALGFDEMRRLYGSVE